MTHQRAVRFRYGRRSYPHVLNTVDRSLLRCASLLFLPAAVRRALKSLLCRMKKRLLPPAGDPAFPGTAACSRALPVRGAAPARAF